MFDDRKIKKQIKKQVEKENREEIKSGESFDEFCAQNNIAVKNSSKRQSQIIIACSVAVLVCIITLTVVLPILHTDPNPDDFTFYGDADVENLQITEEEFFSTEIDPLLDFNNVEGCKRIEKVRPLDNESVILAYSFAGILYGFWSDEDLYAFELNLTIRLYEGYSFTGYEQYNNPQYTVNDNCAYNITAQSNAYITILTPDCEYFISVKNFEGITPVNTDTVETFIRHIL